VGFAPSQRLQQRIDGLRRDADPATNRENNRRELAVSDVPVNGAGGHLEALRRIIASKKLGGYF